jgi:hypothetical protein
MKLIENSLKPCYRDIKFLTPKNNHAHRSVDPIADLVHNTIFLPVFRAASIFDVVLDTFHSFSLLPNNEIDS